MDVSEEISVNMHRARAKMSELAKAHAKALMPSFADSREDHHFIEVLSHEITDLLRTSEKKLRKLSSAEHSEDSNVRRNVQVGVSTDSTRVRFSITPTLSCHDLCASRI